MPDRIGSASRQQSTANRALSDTADLKLPQLVLGMDVLRHLHIYMAFKEKRFYVSAGSPLPAKKDKLQTLDQALAVSTTNANLLNSRCFERALQKVMLTEALQDCDLALKIRPENSAFIDSKGLVLYQLGRYQEALNAYDEALKISPNMAASLFMRGHTKQKLGDAAGGASDIAAAKSADPDIMSVFEGAMIEGN